MSLCSKPNRKVEVDGDLLKITLVDCNKCEGCTDVVLKKRTTSKNRTDRKMKRAYWRYKTQQREIVEIINIE